MAPEERSAAVARLAVLGSAQVAPVEGDDWIVALRPLLAPVVHTPPAAIGRDLAVGAWLALRTLEEFAAAVIERIGERGVAAVA